MGERKMNTSRGLRLGLMALFMGSVVFNMAQWWRSEKATIRHQENEDHLLTTRTILYDAWQGIIPMDEAMGALMEAGQKHRQDTLLHAMLQSLENTYSDLEQVGEEVFPDAVSQEPERSREFLMRLRTLSQEYQAILQDNLHLTDSIYRLRMQNQAKDARYDSLRYVFGEQLDAMQKAQQKPSAARGSGSVRVFKSPSGVDIYYLGEVDDEGRADGQGVAIYANGNSYEGGWKNGKKDGKGRYRFADGEMYEGAFVQDKRQGMGSYVRRNGESYRGYWASDLREGEGQVLDKKGKVIRSGIWKRDKLVQEKAVEFGVE